MCLPIPGQGGASRTRGQIRDLSRTDSSLEVSDYKLKGGGRNLWLCLALSSVMFKTPGREGRRPDVTRLEVFPGDSVEGQRPWALWVLAGGDGQCAGATHR